jgi:hypothetical protein
VLGLTTKFWRCPTDSVPTASDAGAIIWD